jgi:CRISPR-associated protein Cmr4
MPKDVKIQLLTLHAITFLHPGTGQTTGVVDLPVQREVHSGFPMIASSGLKGSLRDKAERDWGKGQQVDTLFGSENAETAGALTVTDARILAFPVRSLQQVFVWVICPMVIERLKRDLDLADIQATLPQPTVLTIQSGQAWVSGQGLSTPLFLEEMKFSVSQNSEHAGTVAKAMTGFAPAGAGFDQNKLVLISDDDFSYLVRHATQVSARIALNEKKTTTGGGGNLWYEETLPPETLLYALVMANKPRNGANAGITDAAGVVTEFKKLFDSDKYLQVGGNETVGQGWCCTRIVGG